MFEDASTATADVVFPLAEPRREGRHGHPSRRPPAAGAAQRHAPRRRAARLAGALRARRGARPRDRDRLRARGAGGASPTTSPFYAGITEEEIGGRGIRWQERRQRACRRSSSRVRRGAAETDLREHSFRRGAPAAPADGGGSLSRHLPRPLGGPGHRAQPGAALPGARAAARDRRRPTRSGWASSDGDEVDGERERDQPHARRSRSASGSPRAPASWSRAPRRRTPTRCSTAGRAR